MATVAFERVRMEFPGGGVALADIDLVVADRERVVIVGPSGCGKTTLLRLVAGLETPTAGTIRIDGRDVAGCAPRDRNVAMVFQDYALYPHLTVRNNLAFPLRMRRLARAEIAARVARTSAMLGLDALLDRYPHALSGGQRQRVAMGRALVRAPSVFLLDEPLSNLDATLRAQLRGEIARLQRRTATTMLYVTHDQVEAMTLGDRIVVLDRGRIRQIGSPREVYERPANTFVAGFIGTPPMTLVDARLERQAGPRATVWIGERPAGELAWPDGASEGPVTVGIRPDAVRLTSPGTSPTALPARVADVEMLGHECLVRLDVAGWALTARVPTDAAPPREAAVGAVLDARRLYLFSPSGEALAAPSVTDTR